MKKPLLNLGVVAGAVMLMCAISSCKKEEVTAPADNTSTLIYIRAVDKDSSVTNSDQILLR